MSVSYLMQMPAIRALIDPAFITAPALQIECGMRALVQRFSESMLTGERENTAALRQSLGLPLETEAISGAGWRPNGDRGSDS